MLLSVVSVLVVAQSRSEFPEGLMNNPVYIGRGLKKGSKGKNKKIKKSIKLSENFIAKYPLGILHFTYIRF